MRKQSKLLITLLMLVGFVGVSNAQLIDEKDVTITLDLQPVLQLDMTTSNQLEFIFDDINEYLAGITHYAATILKVSSTVSWDLYALGRSQAGTRFMDQQVSYGNVTPLNSIAEIPMSALELRQNQANFSSAGTSLTPPNYDYSSAFASANSGPSATNSLFVNDAGVATPPDASGKYIAGHAGNLDYIDGGSYLTAGVGATYYHYTIDYRILPGLPAIFPNATAADGSTFEDIATNNSATSYAQPGVYTMYVQYVLLEDQ